MDAKTRYTPTENGYAISGSSELFNRTLYGSHKNDENTARFFTFAGDTPSLWAQLLTGLLTPSPIRKKAVFWSAVLP